MQGSSPCQRELPISQDSLQIVELSTTARGLPFHLPHSRVEPYCLRIGLQPPDAGAAAGVSDPLVDFDSAAPDAASASGVAADGVSIVAADPATGVAALPDVDPPPAADPPPVTAVKPSAR